MPLKPRNVLNTLIDAAEQLDGSLSSDDAWERAIALAHRLEFSAINIIEADMATGEIAWFRSSMETEWLGDYMAQDFPVIDPLFLAAFDGQTAIRALDGEVAGLEVQSPKAPDFRDQIVAWDYRAIDSRIFKVANSGRIKGITVARPDLASEPGEDHTIICALINAAVSAPLSPTSPGTLIFNRPVLSPREIDVLCYLAAGLRNDAIAWKLKIAEVTVRAHVTAARNKLGAATREEAIAIAMRDGHLPI